MKPFVLGVDPGQTTGICLIDGAYRDLLQVTPGLVVPIVRSLLHAAPETVLAIERFVVGPRASRSSTPAAGQTTRGLIGALVNVGDELGIRVVQRSASEVKPWATDERLERAGLLAACKGMPHARDAARHAIYAAVSDCGLPDPLSRKSRGTRVRP